jgi:hypothetical protein
LGEEISLSVIGVYAQEFGLITSVIDNMNVCDLARWFIEIIRIDLKE